MTELQDIAFGLAGALQSLLNDHDSGREPHNAQIDRAREAVNCWAIFDPGDCLTPPSVSRSAEVTEAAWSLISRIASQEPWQEHYGRTWEQEAADLILARHRAAEPTGVEAALRRARIQAALRRIEGDTNIHDLTDDEVDGLARAALGDASQ